MIRTVLCERSATSYLGGTRLKVRSHPTQQVHTLIEDIMHITNTHSTSLLALLIAASSAIASPVIGNQGKGSVDTPFSGSIHGSTSYGQQQPLFNNIHGSSHAFEQGSSAISSYIQPSVLKDSLNPSDYEKLIQHVNGLPERRIIALSEHEQDRHLITEGQKALLTFHGIKFMDITEDVLNNVSPASGAGVLSSDDDDDHLPFSASASDLTSLSTSTTTTTTSSNNKDSDAFPTSWKYGRKQLDKSFYKNIDTSRMKTFLQAFSSFRTRYYRSNDGRQSQLYLMQKIHEIITKKENKHLNMTVEEFPHPWGQNSLIVKLPATNHNNSDDNINNVNNVKGTIVVGAHQDSTNLLPFLSAPGADDDGSGTTTVLEVIQILTQGHFIPSSHNVEFHFYSAEEGGMLGSQAVVKAYQERASHSSHSQKVKAMLQVSPDIVAGARFPHIKARSLTGERTTPDFSDNSIHRWT